MKALFPICLALLVCLPAEATVSIEFQLGSVEVPAGSLGVLVADTDDNEFVSPAAAPGTILSVGQPFGPAGDDIIVAVLTNRNLPDWSASKEGFADQLATMDYAALGVAEGQDLILHVFPDRDAGDTIRSDEPHLSYRTGDLGQLTSNSTMGFALPRDGGAYLLAALAPENGGSADLASVDLSALDYGAGDGNFNRSLTQTARHTYFFEVGTPGFLSLEGAGGVGLRAELYGPGGQLLASSTGGKFAFSEQVAAGFHRLVLYRGDSAGGALPYAMEFADEDGRIVRPDVGVGGALTRLTGNHVFGGNRQTVTLASLRAAPVTGYAAISNRGDLPNTLAVRGSKAPADCKIVYFDSAKRNITTGILNGTYRTLSIDAGDAAHPIRVQFTPNKRKIVTGKSVARRTFNSTLRADATAGPAASDSVTIRVQTR